MIPECPSERVCVEGGASEISDSSESSRSGGWLHRSGRWWHRCGIGLVGGCRGLEGVDIGVALVKWVVA